MGQFDVQQRTRDGYFNATELMKAWNLQSGMKKEIKDFLGNKSTMEFVSALQSDDSLNGVKSPYLTARGKSGGTWMHPLLFIDFAMWLNPSFKVKVLRFVHDEMITYRNEAGDAYKELSAAVSTFTPANKIKDVMTHVSKGINFIIFGSHKTLIRNTFGDESKMRELWHFERMLTSLIKDGFITSYANLMRYLRRKYSESHAISASV